MALDDDDTPADSFSAISSRPPFLPPCTPAQANQALQTLPRGLGLGLLGSASPNDVEGLGAALRGARPIGLAGDLAFNGVTSLPDCDPRLVNVTTDPSTPSFQTARGTIIKMNKPAPDTTLPWGEGVDRLVKFADNTGLQSVDISGGTESKDHSPNGAHPANGAIDVSASNPLSDEAVRQAALAAGYTHGMFEIRPGGKPGDPPVRHWHLQVGPANIINAPAYDLAKGPIKTKDYTQAATQPP